MYIVPKYNKTLKFGICDTYMINLRYQFIYHFDQNKANFILSVLSFKRELNLTCDFCDKMSENNTF